MSDLYIIGSASKNLINGKAIINQSDFSNASLLDPLPTIDFTLMTFNDYIVIFSNQQGQIHVVRGETIPIASPDGKTTDLYDFVSDEAYSIEITVNRSKRFSSEKETSPNVPQLLTFNNTNKIEVPILDILGQTLIDGSDIGDIIFTIKDEFQYYCTNDILPKFNKCGTYNVSLSDLKTTIFHKCCPKIVSVVIGNGETWYDKTEYLFKKLGKEKIGANFGDFRLRMFLYAMLKFILTRILYNKFDINFLLRKYNERFLKDLGKSRFCEALKVLLDPNSIIFGYDKYFKLDICNDDQY